MSKKRHGEYKPREVVDFIQSENEIEEAVAPIEEVTEKPVEEIVVMKGKVSGCQVLNVRSEPGLFADIVGTITKGVMVNICETESTDDFYKVYADNGLVGFCMKRFIAIQQ